MDVVFHLGPVPFNGFAQGNLLPCLPDLTVDVRQLPVQLRLFRHELLPMDPTLLQRGDGVHVAGEGFLHAGHAGLIAVLCRGEGLRVGEGVVECPPFLLPHVEDGALLVEAGQRFLCAGADGLQVLCRGDAMRPQEGELFLVALKLHDLPPEMGRHLRRVLPLPDLTQQIEIMHIEGKEAGVFRMRLVWPILRP